MRLVFAAAFVLATVWWAPPTYAFITQRCRAADAILSHDTPKAPADWLVEQEISGRVFAPMDWADYLIWRTGGAVQPLVFSHVHLTSPELWQNFLVIRNASDGWPAVVKRYRLDYFVLSRQRNQKLAKAVSIHPRCHVLHVDRQGSIVRANHK
jgi:hypothetical protein